MRYLHAATAARQSHPFDRVVGQKDAIGGRPSRENGYNPYSSILRYKVFTLMPNWRAASALLPAVSCNTNSI